MGRYRFGEGEYRYFERPYPEPIDELKRALYPRLLPIARDWWHKLGRDAPWPDDLDDWLDMCHAAGQTRSTAILLKYGQGDWNALHRDLYGDLVFPLQVVINLSEPGVDHTGGEFLLLEQRPRAQSRGTATLLPHGHGYRLHHPRATGEVGEGMVGGARPARCLGRPLRRALHPRPRIPRRRMTIRGTSAATGEPGSTGDWIAVALRAIANGGYVSYRVFFADEAAAIAAGYRPCARVCRIGTATGRLRRASTQNDDVVHPRALFPSGPTACRSTASTRTCSNSSALRFRPATTSSALGNSW